LGSTDPIRPLLRDAEGHAAAGVARCVAGGSLAMVEYDHLPSADGSSFTRLAEADGDLAAVRLTYADGHRCAITWAMDGTTEGLSLSTAADALASSSAERIDVSQSPPWIPLIGRNVASLSLAWRRDAAAGKESLFALKCGTSGGASFVVALGGVSAEGIEYLPDEVVVIFDDAAAERYVGGWSDVVANPAQ
jgi:hypothetical protein